MRKKQQTLTGLLAGLVLIFTLGCERPEEELKPATFSNTAEIFIDGFSAGLEYAAFGDSKLTAFTVDNNVSAEGVIGTSSMRFDIPNVGDPEGSYAGGIFRDLGGRDLTGYNALTFYAKASKGGTVDLLGFGTDFGDNKYATSSSIQLNTAWNKYIIPIPDPAKLVREEGLFVIAEGPENGEGYTIWLDIVKFEKLGTLAHPRPAILNGEDIEQQTFIGVNATITGLTQTFNLANGANQTVIASPAYFQFNSTDTTIAKVDELGQVTILGEGTAKITATLAGVEAAGSLTLESLGEFEAAPIPDRDQADVISIFSDAYTNQPVDFYNGYFAPFQTTLGQDDIDIDGDKIIKYSQLNFVATEFKNPTVNATTMTHFHVDIQVENSIAPGDFIKIQLGDFGPDGAFGGGNDVSGVYEINTTPPLVSNQWISLDIPLSDFTGLSQRANLAQIFFITDGTATDLPGTITDILVDNMYFYKDDGGGGGNCQPEMGQSLDATNFDLTFQTDPGSMIGSFGGNYTYLANPDSENAINPSCFVGQIARDGQQFANTQIEFASKFDFNTNAGFKLKVWSPVAGTNVLVKLEDKMNDQINTEVPAVTSTASAWEELTFDFATGESGKYDKIILFFELNSSVEQTYYIDDFKLYGTGGGGGGTEPTMAAPTPPVRDAGDVVSIYSDAYAANIAFDNFDAGWCGGAAVTGVSIEGNNTLKKNAGIDCHGIDFASSRQDLSAFTHIHFDFYTNDTDLTGDVFNVKLVDFAGGAGEVSNLEVNINTGTTPGIVADSWVSVDVDITSLGGVVAGSLTRSDIAQIGITTANLTNVWYDNIYFYKAAAAVCQPESNQSLDAADFDLNFETDPGSAIGSFGGAYTYIANPDFDNAVNQSCQAGQIARDGQQFANTQIEFASKFDFNTNSGFKLKVWSPVAGTNVLVKLEDKTNDLINTEMAAVTSSASAWEELTFDFASGESDKYDKIILFFELNSSIIETYYIDDFRLYGSGGGGSNGPSTAAPTPPVRDAADVVSIYSDAYADIAFDNFDAGWCGGAAVTGVTVDGNNTLKKNAGVDCHGIDFASGRQDLAAFTHIHFDFYTDDTDLTGDVFNVKLVDFAGGAGEVSALEVNINTGTTPGIVAGTWVSVDIDITSLGGVVAGSLTRSDIAQIGITTANLTNVWYDNIYLYK